MEKKKPEQKKYFFPDCQKTVEAETKEEAEEKIKKLKKKKNDR